MHRNVISSITRPQGIGTDKKPTTVSTIKHGFRTLSSTHGRYYIRYAAVTIARHRSLFSKSQNVTLVDARNELIFDDGTVLVPILPILPGTPGRRD